ncbi:Ribosomal RNA large subunit methyltransferase H [Paenibacillus konkukensis]|uniref:Ribosomal RNA large subunit methyltransferase H n=1 Tax=Paenibacillus konkukensis TaxID=2020716 RepID=A0ABY4RQ16_9BACL|nr:23S rRNA (pseudouridine(1915)-N(3))-methyltransferase RlmH [Paenibacillus konkukensis]UQZ84564.1 Ribosomal RNA large subunit methyltransferase H [Paenibacillus konkukensis]
MKLTIYIINEKMEKFYLEAFKEYEKRLGRYCTIELIQLKKEEQLEKKLNDSSYKILLASTKQTLSSEELASKINDLGVSGKSDVSIIIGSNSAQYDEKLMLSQMEMDAGLKTTILVEQLYRAFRIIHNHPYHK